MATRLQVVKLLIYIYMAVFIITLIVAMLFVVVGVEDKPYTYDMLRDEAGRFTGKIILEKKR